MKKLALLLLLSLPCLVVAQTQQHYPEQLPIINEYCHPGQLSATMSVQWGASLLISPDYWLEYWPHPVGSYVTDTENNGVCLGNDHMQYNYHNTKFCHTWTELWAQNPLYITMSCTVPGNDNCYIYSIDSVEWLRLPENDY